VCFDLVKKFKKVNLKLLYFRFRWPLEQHGRGDVHRGRGEDKGSRRPPEETGGELLQDLALQVLISPT